MSIRCSGVASRSFIIGIRLCPPAMIRAPGADALQRRDRALDAGRALVRQRCGGLHQLSFPGLQGRFRQALACARRASRSGSYCTGESVPITGERGRRAGRTAGPRDRAAAPPGCRRSTLRSAGPFGLAAAIGASRPSRASVSVPLCTPRRSAARLIFVLSGKLRRPAAAAPGYSPSIRPTASASPAFLTSSPSSRSTPASRLVLIVVHDLARRERSSR